MKRRYQFFAERVDYGRLISLHLTVVSESEFQSKHSVAQPVVMQEVVDEEYRLSPMLQLNHESAQSLMDELWHVGLRPTQGKQSEGQMSAIGDHLQDMRAIVFAKLEVQKP